MENSIDRFYADLKREVQHRAGDNGQWTEDAFFEVVAGEMQSSGDVETADRAFWRNAKGDIRVDGYGGDPLESDGILTLFVVDYVESDGPTSLSETESARIFKRLRSFLEKSLTRRFREGLEETSQAFGLADLVAARWDSISKVRLTLLTNRVLSSRVDSLAAEDIGGRPVVHSVWDTARLWRYSASRSEKEELEIDFRNDFGVELPALSAHIPGADYEAYLVVMPGDVLAKVYDRWTTRLLEQNVRVFLQARSGVNKGIKRTLEEQPGMFFAFNNGITATAESVELDAEGTRLVKARNLQIVNGGQTTASIHAAFRHKKPLEHVFVQMKLSIIPPELTTKVVPLISQYANSQNKVSDADFFSNHEFHVRIEDFSRRLFAPRAEGTVRETKWFYERARGQYADERARSDGRKLKSFDADFPKQQLFTKTDLAKFVFVWEMFPHIVSRGAQKNFAAFADWVQKAWVQDKDQFNELRYKEYIAKCIIFKAMERIVQSADWYIGGYRANIVAYGISKLAHDLGQKGLFVDFQAVWQQQSVPDVLQRALEVFAREADFVIRNPDGRVTNVTEWAKKDACWHTLMRRQVPLPPGLEQVTIGKDEKDDRRKDAKRDQQVVDGILAQKVVLHAGPAYWTRLHDWGLKEQLLAYKENDFLGKLPGMLTSRQLPSEKQAAWAVKIALRLMKAGFPEELPRPRA